MTGPPPTGLRFVRDPELARVSALMEATWEQPRWVYDPGLLEYHLRKPSTDRDLLLGLEDDRTGELVAYYALMPLELQLGSQSHRGVFGSFLTTARARQGHGVGRAVQTRLLRMAIDKGHDLYLAFCEVGAASNASIGKSCASLGLVTTAAATVGYLGLPAAAIRMKLPGPSELTRAYRDEDEAAVCKLLETSRAPLTLRRRHDRSDYHHRFGWERACTLVYAAGASVRGLAHLLMLDVLDGGRCFRNAYLQDLETGDLSESEGRQFLVDVLHEAERAHCHLVMAPSTGYLPDGLLGSLGFRKTARRLNLLMTPLRAGFPEAISEIKSFRMDVF